LLVLVAAAFAVSAHTTTAGGQAMRTPESKGYAKVNDVELYYEVHGDGPPLIMLHGGVTPSEMFGAPLAEMAKAHKVVALHARGHGLSKDSSRPVVVRGLRRRRRRVDGLSRHQEGQRDGVLKRR